MIVREQNYAESQVNTTEIILQNRLIKKENLMAYESSRKFIPSKKRKKGPQPRGSGKKMKEESPLWEVGPYSGSGGGSRSRA